LFFHVQLQSPPGARVVQRELILEPRFWSLGVRYWMLAEIK